MPLVSDRAGHATGPRAAAAQQYHSSALLSSRTFSIMNMRLSASGLVVTGLETDGRDMLSGASRL